MTELTTIADSPHVLRSIDYHIFIHGQASTRIFLSGDLLHQVFHHRAHRIPGGPNQETVRKYFDLLGSIRFRVFGFDVLISHFLHHGLGADGNGFLLEGGFGIVDKLLRERRKNVREGFDKSHMEMVRDLRHPFLEILLEKVLQLASELDTGRPTSNDNLNASC